MDFQVQILVDNVIAKSGFKILHPNNDVRIANHISSTLKRIAKAASRRMIANSAWTTATVTRPPRSSTSPRTERPWRHPASTITMASTGTFAIPTDRKSVGLGKSVSERVNLGGHRI